MKDEPTSLLDEKIAQDKEIAAIAQRIIAGDTFYVDHNTVNFMSVMDNMTTKGQIEISNAIRSMMVDIEHSNKASDGVLGQANKINDVVKSFILKEAEEIYFDQKGAV